ncbi:FRG domain-containing protein [Ideonella paludis]|uniref:FRG domain-containing protein n=2 Tax=Ideonella paludis TaxID=1233411 RepID=A0ABS5DTW5_9BURK|nr:FRG domain-containing protein [Ideonella paludis]
MTAPAPAEHLIEMCKEFRTEVSPATRRWEYFRAESGKAVLLPANFAKVLFRGQTCRYTPSLSPLGRGLEPGVRRIRDLPLRSQAKLVERVARRLWFSREMKSHPGYQWLASQHLDSFEGALAQHYGVPTGYMDLSESFEVACFFATCELDTTGTWRAKEAGTGVLYMLPTDHIRIRPDGLQPIGLQVLPRPCEQFGWLVVCGIGDDFEDIPGLQMMEFSHLPEVGRFFLDKFSGGEALFPPDAAACVFQHSVRIKSNGKWSAIPVRDARSPTK